MTDDSGQRTTPPRGQAPRDNSDLEDSLNQLGRVVGGVMTRLLGANVTGGELESDRVLLGVRADRELDRFGASMGRWLHAAGEGLKEHPDRPRQAIERTLAAQDDPLEVGDGQAPLGVGLHNLAGGLYRTTEAILDRVAPRRSNAPDGEPTTEVPPDETP